ncbi:MAG: crossover junction endodeoxyribonuclease RuvC [Candidatus Levybacteria bacterium]|nr:crossover junction endodeoxyribonuclease RuvC [Candidatus Levybacteria bacterium]
MKILGIDPGIGRTGWGVIEVQSSKFKVQSYGCIETGKDMKLEERIREVYESVRKIIESEKPDVMAIEELFFNTNAKTALIVGQARGVVLLAAAQAKLPVSVYTPLQVKIAVTGYGRAEKGQVEKMMMVQLGLKEKPKIDDTADALAIALTHAYSYKAPR